MSVWKKNPPTHPEEGHGQLGIEAAGPSVLVLFPSRATLGIPIIPNILVQVSEWVSGWRRAGHLVRRYLAARAAGRGDALEGDDWAGCGFLRRIHWLVLRNWTKYISTIHYLIINCTGALYTVCTVQLFGNSESLNGMKIFSLKHLILLHRMTN